MYQDNNIYEKENGKEFSEYSLEISKEDFHKYKLLSPLLHIHDTPKKLFFKSKDREILENFLNKNINGRDYKILTVVGSRKYSHYGKESLEYLIKSLAKENIIIISGLAIGIDSLAHKNAIKNNLPTIAIPGSGLGDKVLYPAVNISLTKEIIISNNILISEYEEDRKSQLYFFPARNRIMAAISDAVLIVEAGEKSGTLITARLAMEYGKNVGVIPNNIFAEVSKGSNKLMQEGAQTILKVEDILEILNISKDEQGLLELDFNNKKHIDRLREVLESLNQNERKILEKILQNGNMEKDILLREMEEESSISFTDSLVSLMSLEINGFIKEELGEIRLMR
jgi:DNA processing protein